MLGTVQGGATHAHRAACGKDQRESHGRPRGGGSAAGGLCDSTAMAQQHALRRAADTATAEDRDARCARRTPPHAPPHSQRASPSVHASSSRRLVARRGRGEQHDTVDRRVVRDGRVLGVEYEAAGHARQPRHAAPPPPSSADAALTPISRRLASLVLIIAIFAVGFLPKELGDLANLKSFDVSQNLIRGELSIRTERFNFLLGWFQLSCAPSIALGGVSLRGRAAPIHGAFGHNAGACQLKPCAVFGN